MSLLNRIKQFFCKPPIKSITRFLHIRGFMKNIYHYFLPLALPKNRKKRTSFCGIEAFFQVNIPQDMNLVEVPLLEEYADGERHVLKHLLRWLKPGDVAYDIGANIGVYTIFMAKRVGESGRIVAFEPERKTYERLLTNIALNNLNNVTPFKIALGSDFGEGLLYSGTSEGATFNLMDRGENLGQKIRIVQGDFFVVDESLPVPKVVKIDVEGYEYFVIQGLEDTLKPKIIRLVCCEIHPNMLPEHIEPNMVIDLLKSFGFSIIKRYPRGATFHIFCYKE